MAMTQSRNGDACIRALNALAPLRMHVSAREFGVVLRSMSTSTQNKLGATIA